MSTVVDQAELKGRARLLERHKVPVTWSRMVAEVWLRLDADGDGSYSHTDAEIARVAGEMSKEKLAIVRAVAWLTVAARSGLKLPAPAEETKASGAEDGGGKPGAS